MAGQPDFSGEWVLNPQASTLSPGADTVQSGLWQIEHREPVFHHKASFVMEAGPRDYEYELRSDGPAIPAEDEGPQSGGWIHWDGSVLVVTFREPIPTGRMTVSFRYELIDDGRRIRAAEQVRGTAWDQDNVWMFDRR
ncbi:MAG TPA: hypothetical protein VGQ37_17910 [Vicinamibacterales bacterium]|jgi:hypothetical protein|nr:hypothetical protein [Vicinamibacterales bacterium]